MRRGSGPGEGACLQGVGVCGSEYLAIDGDGRSGVEVDVGGTLDWVVFWLWQWRSVCPLPATGHV